MQDALEHSIIGRPDFSFLTVKLPKGRSLMVEASAMATMDTQISMRTKFKGGLSRLISGESLFLNEFSASAAAGELSVAPSSPGDLEHVYLNNQTIYLQNSAYLAASPEIKVETKWQGLTKGFFSGESFFLIKCSGIGDLWFNSFGGIQKIEQVDGDFSVDTGHIVAFTEGLDYRVSMLGGYKSLFFSGEGLVCRFSGKGTVWIQTRKINRFTSWLYYYRPVKSRN